MKLLFLAALTSLFTMLYSADTGGFRDLKWGDSPNVLSDKLVLIKKNNALKISLYKRKNENLKIADANLSEIGYYFFDNKFYMIALSFKNSLNSSKLKKTFDSKYGNPYTVNASTMDQYHWLGGNSILVVSYYKHTNLGSVMIANIALQQQAEVYKTSASYH